MNTTISLNDLRAAGATISVPMAGEALGLSRAGAYRAAKVGSIPTIKIGTRVRVPTDALIRMIDKSNTETPQEWAARQPRPDAATIDQLRELLWPSQNAAPQQ